MRKGQVRKERRKWGEEEETRRGRDEERRNSPRLVAPVRRVDPPGVLPHTLVSLGRRSADQSCLRHRTHSHVPPVCVCDNLSLWVWNQSLSSIWPSVCEWCVSDEGVCDEGVFRLHKFGCPRTHQCSSATPCRLTLSEWGVQSLCVCVFVLVCVCVWLGATCYPGPWLDHPTAQWFRRLPDRFLHHSNHSYTDLLKGQRVVHLLIQISATPSLPASTHSHVHT